MIQEFFWSTRLIFLQTSCCPPQHYTHNPHYQLSRQLVVPFTTTFTDNSPVPMTFYFLSPIHAFFISNIFFNSASGLLNFLIEPQMLLSVAYFIETLSYRDTLCLWYLSLCLSLDLHMFYLCNLFVIIITINYIIWLIQSNLFF